MIDRPRDWPQPGPIDLGVHDAPHASSHTEWWYVNAHALTRSGRSVSLFASFFRIVTGQDEATKAPVHAHSVTWALTDVDGKRYQPDSRVDPDAPRLGLKKVERGEGTKDVRLRRAIREVLVKGRVPYPDQLLKNAGFCDPRRLDLDFDGQRFTKRGDGSYALALWNPHTKGGASLHLLPCKDPIRHGIDGIVPSPDGADMFYYFIPRCDLRGSVTIDGTDEEIVGGSAWYDHEFGRHPPHEPGATEPVKRDIAWSWIAVQLEDGREISAYVLVDAKTNAPAGERVMVIDREGGARGYEGPIFVGTGTPWRSTRTFHEYPVAWRLASAEAGLELHVEAAFSDQEFITVISKPAFWEGRVDVTGTLAGEAVRGVGYVERSGFGGIDSLDQFFSSVGKSVRASVQALIPFEPTWEQARDLIASSEHPEYMEGVDLPQFVRTMARPVREITDRGGKSWRSYAALACCDVVGGDSREFVQWLAMPELLHVGSLIVDDVEDRSTVRRGGPTTHLIYGEPLAINAGSACYFMGQKLLVGPKMSDTMKLRLYDLYFQALRAGHAGQAFDLEGPADMMDAAVAQGDWQAIERRVLCVHRLKTAVPAGTLARMGAVAGRATEAQIEGLGRFFEAVGLAFQVIDDVLNLRGFEGNLKDRGEDIQHGKVTSPVAKAVGLLDRQARVALWQVVKSRPQDPEIVTQTIDLLESCGAIRACEEQARQMVEDAWREIDPLVEDSLQKLMLRAFGWYVLERHY